MYPTKAFSILFEYDWGGNGPLFMNQQELVNSLLKEPYSSYFTSGVDQEAYRKAHIRLKTYISQLFSDTAKRNVTKELKDSLLNLLQEKLPDNYKPEEVLKQIVQDLVAINPVTSRRNYIEYKARELTDEDWTAFNKHIDLWINGIENDKGHHWPPEMNEELYKKGQIRGVREGALLVWGLVQQRLRNTGNAAQRG